MALSLGFTFETPGVYVSESTFGAIPASLASFNAVYMLGYTNKVGAPTNTPTFIQSPDDFLNIFGTSLSTNSIKLFFDQRSGSGIYFVNVPPKASYSLTVPTATPGATYALTIDGYAISYVAVASDTASTILSKLSGLVNTTASHIAFVSGNTLRVNTGTTVTATANITLGAVVAAAAYPVIGDVVTCINTAFDSDLKQGFLIAPEFFQAFTSAADRTALAKAMEALAQDVDYQWFAVADCGALTASSTTGAGAINLALSEVSALSSAKGHLAYYFPYWLNFQSQAVPASASVVGVALRRYRQQGYRQPAAGTQFPVYGVLDTTINLTDKLQAQLNPKNVNCLRKLSAGRGTVVYGARTVSSDPYYRYMATRVIMNVLNGTLDKAFDQLVLSSVDGQGAVFALIKQTCMDVCENMRASGAFYGATPDAAYLVICDTTNNLASDLEAGKVSADVVVKPSPTLEFLHIRTTRANIGSNLSEFAQSGDTSSILDATALVLTANSSTPKAE